MIIDHNTLNELTIKAKASPRLRMNLDLRNSPKDQSQRMLNAIEPGSPETVHRHTKSSETITVLRGRILESFYDDKGAVQEVTELSPCGQVVAISIPIGMWHSARALETGTILLTCKDGPYETLGEGDILKNN